MFDSEYFRAQLQRDAESAGGEPVVEVYLVNGHSHRVRSIIDVAGGYVALEVYRLKGDPAVQKPSWREQAAADRVPQETFRAAIAYESIVEVRVDPPASQVKTKAGFFAA